MTEITQRSVYEYLVEHGSTKDYGKIARNISPDQFCDCCGQQTGTPINDVETAVKKLYKSGHVRYGLHWEVVPKPLDGLATPTEAFGAGAGETYEGELPPDKL